MNLSNCKTSKLFVSQSEVESVTETIDQKTWEMWRATPHDGRNAFANQLHEVKTAKKTRFRMVSLYRREKINLFPSSQ